MSRSHGIVRLVVGSAVAGLLAGFGGTATASTDVDDLIGGIIWRGLDPHTKARVCHAYYAGGKLAIRQVVTVRDSNSSRIDWSSQKPFQRYAAAKCEQRKRNR